MQFLIWHEAFLAQNFGCSCFIRWKKNLYKIVKNQSDTRDQYTKKNTQVPQTIWQCNHNVDMQFFKKTKYFFLIYRDESKLQKKTEIDAQQNKKKTAIACSN